jgi:hypothetical protein
MVPNAHCTDPLQEGWTIRGVSIPNEISRRVVPRERLGDLARDPNVIEFAKDKPPLHTGNVQSALIQYLIAACGARPLPK